LKSDALFHIPFPLKDYQLASLKYCQFNFSIAKNDVTFFNKLRVVENLYKYPGYYHPGLMSETARLIKNSFETLKTKNRKIYITRKSASRRKILNESEIIEVVMRHGFEIFDFDLINFQEQVEIIINTSILVSLHGAALTNMMFMEPASTIIELLPKETMNDKCYFILAGTMKHNYYYLTCDMDGSSHITSNFQVDLSAFEKVLTDATSKQFKSFAS
jgi:capsular polysaccharide biosynthesis protein